MKKFILFAAGLALCAGFTSCSDNDEPEEIRHNVVLENEFPAEFSAEEYTVTGGNIKFTELNTRKETNIALNAADGTFNIQLPDGVYDYTGEIMLTTDLATRTDKSLVLRTVGTSVVINSDTRLSFDWFLATPSSGFVLSEIYAAGSPNAAGTAGLRDAYVRIYNNSDQTLYADGLAFVESDFVNSRTNDNTILTPANDRNVNFTAGTVWVIPGNGTDVPVAPGEYITLTDQAVNWGEQVVGALDMTGADFEWYNDHKSDTDNPDVANLDLWYCYSKTVWIMSNQCNRSYALVRFPEGMTKEKYLAEYDGTYEYLSATTGKQMTKTTCVLIPNEWIIDGVNLSNDEVWVKGALAPSIDCSYASISTKNSDKARFGKKFVRKESTKVGGRVVLQDTDNSAADFNLVSVK